MSRNISIIGSIVAMVIAGGTIAYGSQNNAIAPPDDGALSSRVVPVDIITDPSPVAVTGVASDMTSSTVTFHGVIYPHGEEISYWFEYSSDPFLGLILIRRTPRVLLITDSDNKRSVEADVSGLMNSTKYYFRIVTEESSGTVRASRASFNTK